MPAHPVSLLRLMLDHISRSQRFQAQCIQLSGKHTWADRANPDEDTAKPFQANTRLACLMGSRSPMQCRLGTPILRASRPSGK